MGLASAIGLGVGAIGSLVGGSKAAGAQKDAAAKSADATVQAAQLGVDAQRQNFVDTTRLNQGGAQAGNAATAQMLQLMGLPVPQSLTSGAAYDSIYGGGGSGGGGFDAGGYFAANPDVAQAAQNLTPADKKYMKEQGYGDTPNDYAKFHYETMGQAAGRQLGTDGAAGAGANGLAGGANSIDVQPLGPGGATDLIKSTPGYEFRFGEGMRAIDSSAANKGMLMSGANIRRAQEFGDDYAAREFGSYWNRLAGIAGAGQTSTGAITQTGGNTANNLANIYNQQGAGLSSSYTQAGNAAAGNWQNIGETAAGLGGAVFERYG